MLWEVAEPIHEGQYEGGGASWRNTDTRVKRPTSSRLSPSRLHPRPRRILVVEAVKLESAGTAAEADERSVRVGARLNGPHNDPYGHRLAGAQGAKVAHYGPHRFQPTASRNLSAGARPHEPHLAGQWVAHRHVPRAAVTRVSHLYSEGLPLPYCYELGTHRLPDVNVYPLCRLGLGWAAQSHHRGNHERPHKQRP